MILNAWFACYIQGYIFKTNSKYFVPDTKQGAGEYKDDFGFFPHHLKAIFWFDDAGNLAP